MTSAVPWVLTNRSKGIKIPLGHYEKDTPTLLDVVTDHVRAYPDTDPSDWVLWVGKTNFFYSPVYATESRITWAWMHGDRGVC